MRDPFTWFLDLRRRRVDDATWFAAAALGIGTGVATSPAWWPVRVVGAALCVAVGVALFRSRRRPKHRWRTAWRTRLPLFLVEVVPKGRTDCGAHEWYLSEGTTWRCYHCAVGVKTEEP